jgi:formate hydrogenlyase transcriptional activator
MKRRVVRRSGKTASDGKVHVEVAPSLSGRRALNDGESAEDKLQKEIRELRQIIDSVPINIGVLDSAGEIVLVNQTFLDYSGLTLEELRTPGIRERFVSSVHPEDRERMRREREAALAAGREFQYEERVRWKDGRYNWFQVHYKPLRNEQGEITRWLATKTDIGERKQAEERLRKENISLREEIDHSSLSDEIIGSSDVLRRALFQVAKVAPADSTVLVVGESGTGKELVARAIHRRSRRAGGAFIAVNCAAIPQSLMASELFGHEKGAFTGALERRIGRFESAEGGTIFLDEVGELSAESQALLLRVLQEREFERVGSVKPIRADVRVVAATNRDLSSAISAGTFRQDLYYRLNVFPIHVPSLRERAADIPLLLEYFIQRFSQKAGKKILRVSKETIRRFQVYDWPGNIRELQNVVERGILLCEGETFDVDETWLRRQSPRPHTATVPLAAALVEHEKELIESALAACRGRVSGPGGAAAKLGIPRQTLDARIASLRINKYRFKGNLDS